MPTRSARDTTWWLHALHEQATKGPCKHPRPNPFDPWNGEFRFWDEAPEITWDAYKALRDTTPHEAMARYVATVEMENPHWWDVMTAGMDDTRKGALVSSAADCAREYHDAVKAGLLPYEPDLAERSIAKGTAEGTSTTRNGHGSSAANGIAAMLSGVLNGVLNDDDAEAEAEPPERRAPDPSPSRANSPTFPPSSTTER